MILTTHFNHIYFIYNSVTVQCFRVYHTQANVFIIVPTWCNSVESHLLNHALVLNLNNLITFLLRENKCLKLVHSSWKNNLVSMGSQLINVYQKQSNKWINWKLVYYFHELILCQTDSSMELSLQGWLYYLSSINKYSKVVFSNCPLLQKSMGCNFETYSFYYFQFCDLLYTGY